MELTRVDRRTFLDWHAPALPAAAELLCSRYAGPDGIRLDRAVVVLPGARAGRRLKELLLAEADRLGMALVPPRVTTIGRLPELLYEPVRPLAEPTLARRVWSRSLRATAPDRLSGVFGRRPAPTALTEWDGLAREVATLQREVAGAGHRFRDVAGVCGSSPLFDDFDRWEVLGGIQAEYESRLARLGWSDRDLARLDALEAGRLRLATDLWLVAVAEMPGVLRRMLTALAGAGHAVGILVHGPAGRAEAFDDLGCVRPEAWLDAPIPLRDEALAVEDRPEHQALRVARILAAHAGALAAEDIVLGVPRRELVPFLERRLSDAGVPVHDSVGDRVSRTAPYRLLAAVADYLDGRRFDALAALARHPDVWPWLQGRGRGGPSFSHADGWLRSLDRYYGDHLPARVLGRIPDERGRHGSTVRGLVDFLDRGLSHPGALGGLDRKAGVREWAERAVALLREVYGHQELRSASLADRRLAAALAAIGDAATALRRLPAELDEECTPTQGLRLLLAECAAVTIAGEPERAAVELLGWLELHLDDAPAAVITGVNEPDLPESVSAHAFLPDGLRSRLGLVDNDRRYARDAYQLSAILHSRPHVRVVAGRRSATGDPLRPSRLLLATPGDGLARRVRRFYVDGGSRQPCTTAGAGPEPAEPAGIGEPGKNGETGALPLFEPGEPQGILDLFGAGIAAGGFVLPPEPELPVPVPLPPLRVTDFRTLLEDPYAFALQRVLGLEPLDDAARELDGRGFGNLAHRVLERFGRSGDQNVPDAAVLTARLEALLDEEVGRRFGRHVHVAVRVQVEQLRARLRRFALKHADWLGAGWRVVSAECSTPAGGVAFDVDGEPVFLTARIDRVDRKDTGEWAVFDYKTGDRGEVPDRTHRRRSEPREWVDLQLPLYRRILPSLVAPDGSPIAPDALDHPVTLGYISLPRDLECVDIQLAPWTCAELDEAEEVARDVVRRLRSEPFRFNPEGRRPRYPDTRMDALLGRGQLIADDDEDEEGG
jgi:ATP-dependent helicase/nuclease subunit B